MAELWQLPGPLHHLRTIAEDLRAGRSIVIIRPRQRPPTEYERRIRDQLSDGRAWESIDLDQAHGFDGGRYVDVLFDRFGLTSRDDTSRRTVGRLASDPDWHYRVLWVDATNTTHEQLAPWWKFVGDYAAASQSINALERTPIITVIDGERADALPEQNILLTTRWWWSAIDQLDTAVHVGSITRERDVETSFANACVEVAAFDLSLAEELVQSWDGRLHTLTEVLDAYAASWHDNQRVEGLRIEPRGDRDRPGRRAHLQAWDAGILDRWGGRPTWHLSAMRGADRDEHLHHLIWKAQLATMLPELERRRVDIARWCERQRQHLRRPVFDGVDIMELEYQKLLEFMDLLPHGRRDQQRRKLLWWMRDTRNALAHADVVDPTEIRRGRAMLDQVPTGVS